MVVLGGRDSASTGGKSKQHRNKVRSLRCRHWNLEVGFSKIMRKNTNFEIWFSKRLCDANFLLILGLRLLHSGSGVVTVRDQQLELCRNIWYCYDIGGAGRGGSLTCQRMKNLFASDLLLEGNQKYAGVNLQKKLGMPIQCSEEKKGGEDCVVQRQRQLIVNDNICIPRSSG